MLEIDDKRRAILEAAITQFSQYGYRKTSMEDIAGAAGVSRPSLYVYFENKEEIFRSLVQLLNQEAIDDAQSALIDNRANEPVTQRIERALIAFNVALYRRLHDSPHGEELMDESSRLSGNITQDFFGRFQTLLQDEFTYADEQGELALASAGVTAEQAAETIRYAAIGLKTGTPDTHAYETRLQHFIRVYLAGLVCTPNRKGNS